METKYVEYAEKLNKATILPASIIAIACIVFLVLSIVGIKLKDKKIAFGCVACGIFVSLLTYFTCVYPFQEDVKQNAYVLYTGEFFVEASYSVKRGREYILLKTNKNENSIKYHLLCDTSFVEDGKTYFGTIVYTEHSKSLVDIDLNND